MSPTFWVEATIAPRGPRLYWTRFLYAGLLLFIVASSIPHHLSSVQQLDAQRQAAAEFGAQFFTLFAWVQTIGVLLVGPALFAGIVAGDRERGVLDHILTTDLSSREIVLGKLAAKLLEAFHFLAVAVPVLALAMLVGGIREDVLAMLVAITAALVLSIAGVSLYVSTIAATSREAVARVYTLEVLFYAVVPLIVTCLIALVPELLGGRQPDVWLAVAAAFHPAVLLGATLEATYSGDPPPWSLVGGFVALHSLAFVVAVTAAVHSLRRVRIAPKKTRDPARGLGWLEWLRPLAERDPVLWKDLTLERAAARVGWLRRLAAWLIGAGVLLGGLYAFASDFSLRIDDRHGEFYHYAAWVNTTLACVGLLLIAVRASCAVTSEIEKDTWTVLTATPLSAAELVRSKRWASLYGAAGVFALMLFHDALCLVREPTSIFAIAVATLVALVMAHAISALAVWISTAAKSSVTAIVKSVAACLFLGGGYLLFATCCLAGPAAGAELFVAACVPFLLMFPYYIAEPGATGFFLTPFVLGSIGYAVAGRVWAELAALEIESRYRAAGERREFRRP